MKTVSVKLNAYIDYECPYCETTTSDFIDFEEVKDLKNKILECYNCDKEFGVKEIKE